MHAVSDNYFLYYRKRRECMRIKRELERKHKTNSKFLSFERYNSDQGVTSGTYKPEKQG